MRRPPARLIAPLAITGEHLRLMLAVWSRGELFPEAQQKALQSQDGKPLDNTRSVTTRDGVAIIPVYGPLFRHASMFTAISGGVSYAALAKDLQKALEAPEHAILFDWNTPGGEVDGCAELADAIMEARKVKPVYGYVGGMAASAGYWLASACDEIICSRTAMLGSIGVRQALMDDSDRDKRDGINVVELISSQSPGKRDKPIDDEILAKAQAHVDYLASIFIESVAAQRGVSPEKVTKDFGQGDVLIGQQAVTAGMAERLGSFEEVLAQLAAARGQPSISIAAKVQGAVKAALGNLKIEVKNSPGPAGLISKKGVPMKVQSQKSGARAEGNPEPMPKGSDEDKKPEGEEEEKCAHCSGSGNNPDGTKCKTCSGSGKMSAGADDGDGDGDDNEEKKKAADEGDQPEGEEEEKDMGAEEEKKDEKAAARALATKLGLPANASMTEILLAANAGSVPASAVSAIVEKQVSARFAAEEKTRKQAEAKAAAAQLSRDAVAGGFQGDPVALEQFAAWNFAGAEKLAAREIAAGRALYGRVTQAGSPAGAERPAVSGPVMREEAGVSVVRSGQGLSAAAKALSKKEKISYEAALDRVVADQPDLFKAYRAGQA